MKYTTASKIVQAKKFFEANPTGKVTTGIWTDPTWTKASFDAWFRKCLLEKCGGGQYTARQWDKLRDARTVNEYMRGIRHSGCSGLLRDPKMQKKYPHINRQIMEF